MENDNLIIELILISQKNSISQHKRDVCADAAGIIFQLQGENAKLRAELSRARRGLGPLEGDA